MSRPCSDIREVKGARSQQATAQRTCALSGGKQSNRSEKYIKGMHAWGANVTIPLVPRPLRFRLANAGGSLTSLDPSAVHLTLTL